ncbi:LysR family transcriptional regulator [Embleya sp. NPDC001921]
MELRQIRYFVAVAEELHFGQAAERLRIGQPTVSQQIRRLERELGLALFRRTTRRVTLTPAGHAFLPHARTMLGAADVALDEMAALRTEEAAVVRLGTSVGLGTHLDGILARMAEHSPETVVELVSATTRARLRAVRAGELDAAFVRGATRSPGLDLIPLWRDPLVVALPAGHPLTAGETVAITDLADLPLRIAAHEANSPLVDLVLESCRDAGFEPLLGPPFTTDQDTLAAIGTGRPSWTVFYAAQARTLPALRTVFRPFTAPAPALSTALAVRPNASARRLAALLDAYRVPADPAPPSTRALTTGAVREA